MKTNIGCTTCENISFHDESVKENAILCEIQQISSICSTLQYP